jgi:DNA-binding Lrp family transcriptional regulator
MTKTYTPEDRVRIAARAERDARRFLEVQIQDARAKGTSLRAIAEAAGVSHEQVRRILARVD